MCENDYIMSRILSDKYKYAYSIIFKALRYLFNSDELDIIFTILTKDNKWEKMSSMREISKFILINKFLFRYDIDYIYGMFRVKPPIHTGDFINIIETYNNKYCLSPCNDTSRGNIFHKTSCDTPKYMKYGAEYKWDYCD